MQKILVTGATGFIGNYVVRELLDAGYRVVASSSHAERARAQPWFGKVDHYIPFDLGNFDPATDLYQLFGKPDGLLHLAWEGLPNYRAPFHLESNLPRQIAFLKNLVRHGLKDMTITGTCFEYGMQNGCLYETLPADPQNPYGQAKDRLRLSLEELQLDSPFVLKWVRLFYMYGAGQSPNSLFSQLTKALNNQDKVFNMSGGEQVRDFLPVAMVAKYLVSIAGQQKITGIINCCSGQPVTVREWVEELLKKGNQPISLNLGYYAYPDYEPMSFWGDVHKLNKILGKI
ncbi:MAG TPA: NAD(P)-dependent oxidoreductase [Puia sp.]|nr:NAD(P)-dependent oxidoreductase [Puia sp.]